MGHLTLELILWLLLAFLIGCILGCLFRKLFSSGSQISGTGAATGAAATAAAAGAVSSSAKADADADAAAAKAKADADAAKAKADADSDAAAEKAKADAAAAAAARVKADAETKAKADAAQAAAAKAKADADAAAAKAKADADAAAAKADSDAAAAAAAKADADAKAAADNTATAAPLAAVGTAKRPKGLAAARDGKADDLQRISGIGPKIDKTLNSLGFYHFDQIANWDKEEVQWVDEHLRFKGRIEREEWIPQAKLLANGDEAEFKRLYGTGGIKDKKTGKAEAGSRTAKTATSADVQTLAGSVKADTSETVGSKPQGISAARDGKADDLKRISGVGPKLEGTLNGLGVYHFDQIAAWKKDEVDWVDNYLSFKGRIERDEWIPQAKLLARGDEAEFAKLYGGSAGKSQEPERLKKARGGKADNLQQISGVGPKLEKTLHKLGFFHFDQIAAWTSKEVEWVDENLTFKGRIEREEWIPQCKLLAKGDMKKFEELYGTGGLKSKSGKSKSGSRTRKS